MISKHFSGTCLPTNNHGNLKNSFISSKNKSPVEHLKTTFFQFLFQLKTVSLKFKKKCLHFLFSTDISILL